MDDGFSYRDEVYKLAGEVRSREDLDKLLAQITAYPHDYNTIVYGCMAAMKGAFNYVNRSETGGITGFQAGCLGWECVREFLSIDGPVRLQDFKNLLYPQYADRFQKVISPDTWEWVQKKAVESLTESPDAHPNVVAHWKSIIKGKVPFGFVVKDI